MAAAQQAMSQWGLRSKDSEMPAGDPMPHGGFTKQQPLEQLGSSVGCQSDQSVATKAHSDQYVHHLLSCLRSFPSAQFPLGCAQLRQSLPVNLGVRADDWVVAESGSGRPQQSLRYRAPRLALRG